MGTEFVQAQGMTGVVQWNYQRLVDIKQPDVNPPAPSLSTPLTQVSIEKIVEGILVKQQYQPEQNWRQTKTSLACGQPKSRYETDEGAIIVWLCSRNTLP